MKKSTYCYWLLASTMAGNKITNEERSMLNQFLRPQTCSAR